MEAGFLTPRAAARELGVNVKTIYALCDDGKLEHRVTRGPRRRRLYIPKAEVRRLKAAQRASRN